MNSPTEPIHPPAWPTLGALTVAVASALSLTLTLTGCGMPAGDAPAAAANAPSAASGAGAGAAPGPAAAASGPPVTVSTVRAAQRDVPVLITATGSVAPLSSVDVRALASNPVVQVHVKEGQFVRKGDLLFTLDARADEAKLAQVRAQLAKDEAGLADAERQLTRSRELLAQNFISQTALDTNTTAVQTQQALVTADRAAMDAARLSVSYSRITAPSAGRLGAINVFPGSSVQAGSTTLVSVTQLDPISVQFSLPQRYLADALAALKDGGAAVTVQFGEAQAKSKPLSGRLSFVDNAVDAATGTVKVKAVFDNGGGVLWPGAFVNVAMTARTLNAAVVVPQAAIIQGARGNSVYAVQDGKAVPRPVELLYAQGEDAVVGGIKPGERIVLDGKQNLRPGAAVVERERSKPEAGKPDGAKGAGGPGGPSGASAPMPAAEKAPREGARGASAP